ncbi:dihydrodipicolinate synthase family protein [Eubacteriales bacterium mix99]|mgnify:FL=1|jgi:4-hydroxy-tetrahydrodipicolinate synthase
MTNGTDYIPGGVYPTMITPFTEDNRIDFTAVANMIDWYMENGCSGVFAVCQSSEMFFLSDEEKIQLVEFVTQYAKSEARNRGIRNFPVLASGHTGTDKKRQAEMMNKMYDAGADVIVLITNRFGEENSDQQWIEQAEELIGLLPDVKLGLYECPYPRKRLVSDRILSWCAAKDRFLFFKDTCCDQDLIIKRIHTLKGSGMKLFNANGQTLLPTLRAGAAGYCGVMANFHPHLYEKLCKNYATNKEGAEDLQSFLAIASLIESRAYPVCAKYHMNRMGIPMSLHTRCVDEEKLSPLFRREVRQLCTLEKFIARVMDL